MGNRKRTLKTTAALPTSLTNQRYPLDLLPLPNCLCNSLSPSVFCFVLLCFVLFFDLAPLMKQTRSDQHMLPQHSGLHLGCFLAIFNDLFNIYHS